MITSTTTQSTQKKDDKTRELLAAAFWSFSAKQSLLTKSEQLAQINKGYPVELLQVFSVTFDLQPDSLETLLDTSIPAAKRHKHNKKNLNATTSEKLYRIATICHLAENVCDSKQVAIDWMRSPNKALGGSKPITLCISESGAIQVSRVLLAIEWGGAV